MKKINIKSFSKQVIYVLVAVVMLMSYFPRVASASSITPRKVVLGTSVPSLSTTYSFLFTVPHTTVIESASFTACTTASGTCTPAAGFSASSSTLTSQPTNLGDTSGWTVDTGTVNSLRISKTGNVAAPTGSQTVGFSNVTNPNYPNQTFYIRIETFSDDAWSSSIDTGTVAASTAGTTSVGAAVDETLNFSLSDSSVDLGTLTKTSTGVGTSTMTVGTNAATGYSVSYLGTTTLTSGTHIIDAMATAASSTMNSKQFGINLMHNTTPAVGLDKTGTGTGGATTGYDTLNQFKFNTAGDVVASASVPTNDNVFTTSYIANIDSSAAAGMYTTTMTYVMTANF